MKTINSASTTYFQDLVASAIVHAGRKTGTRPHMLLIHYEREHVAKGCLQAFVPGSIDGHVDRFMGMDLVVTDDIPNDPGFKLVYDAEKL